MRFETFAPLAAVPHAFALRDPADDTRSENFELQVVAARGFTEFAAAEQPHGNSVAVVTRPGRVAGVDALLTGQRGLPLVIRCADCAAVFIVDQTAPAIGLVHSGKNGTRANVVGATVTAMNRELGTDPRNCLAFISPSIGPCHYEVDIWAGIEAQLRAAGIGAIHNPRICTACHLDRYYSYRAEKGQTGRMFAVLALA